jgi:CheY-like chemotaxis protein
MSAAAGYINLTDCWSWIVAASRENRDCAAKTLLYAQAADRDEHARTYIQMMVHSAEQAKRTADDLYERVLAQLQAIQKGGSTAHPDPCSIPPNREVTPDVPQLSKQQFSISHDSELSGMSVFNPNGSRELILLVEDDAEVAENATQILAEEGFRVLVADSGAAALRIFQQAAKCIDLVVLDFLLPDAEGDAVFHSLKAVDPSVNVLLGSGFLTQGIAGLQTLDQMRLAGLRGFVSKPYTKNALLEHVSNCLQPRTA